MIKIFAFFFMLVDHIGYIFFPDWTFLRVIGRLALPLFTYGIVQGYIRTRSVKMYLFRIFLLAIISQIPYIYVFITGYYNVLFTLGFGLIILLLIDSKIKLFVKVIICIIIVFICDVLYFEYGIYCILLILSYYIFRDNYTRLILAQLIITVFAIVAYNYPIYQFVAVLSIPIIMVLQSVDYKLPKVVSYGFYPIHLLLIYLVSVLVYF